MNKFFRPFVHFFILLIIVSCAYAQSSVPKFMVGLPDILLDKELDKEMVGRDNFQQWAERILSQNFDYKKRSNGVWIVYSDREDNKTYNEASMSSGIHSTLHFLEKLYVGDVKNGFALVFKSEIKQSAYPNISGPVEWKGWIPLKNLLLWHQCPKNNNGIYQKGVVVYSPGTKSGPMKRNPYYSLSPAESASKASVYSTDLDILYRMKEVVSEGKTYYLLSRTNIIPTDSRPENCIHGWLSEDFLTEWDYRLLLEPTYAKAAVDDYKKRNVYPTIFYKSTNAIEFAKNGSAMEALWKYDKFTSERMDCYRMRNPVLDKGKEAGIYDVATLATIETSEADIDHIYEVRQQLEECRSALDNINLIFVIDNTSSMKKYYPAVAKSLEDIMTRSIDSKLKVGVVLYKDYPDSKTVQYKPLSANIEDIISFIYDNQDNCHSDNADAYEAMFKGLETALDLQKMKYNRTQSNFIVLIGDAGEHRLMNGQNWTDRAKKIAHQMRDCKINFLAYQVNNSGCPADNDFGLQIGTLQQAYSEEIKATIGTGTEFELKGVNYYELKRLGRDKSLLPVYDTYRYLAEGQSETDKGLKAIIVDNFKDFVNVVNNNIKTLNDMLNGTGSGKSVGGLNENAVRELLKWMDIRSNEVEQIIKTIKSGGVAKFYGYAPERIAGAKYDLFDMVLLFTDNELERLIHNLGSINKIESNNKKDAQDALIAIGQSMIGNFNPTGSIGEMLQQIYGIPIDICLYYGTCMPSNLTFEDVLSMEKNDLEDFLNNFRIKLDRLKTIRRNNTCVFKQDGQTYHWIRIEDMPGICRCGK